MAEVRKALEEHTRWSGLAVKSFVIVPSCSKARNQGGFGDLTEAERENYERRHDRIRVLGKLLSESL